jgi:hypothetical protein
MNGVGIKVPLDRIRRSREEEAIVLTARVFQRL